MTITDNKNLMMEEPYFAPRQSDHLGSTTALNSRSCPLKSREDVGLRSKILHHRMEGSLRCSKETNLYLGMLSRKHTCRYGIVQDCKLCPWILLINASVGQVPYLDAEP